MSTQIQSKHYICENGPKSSVSHIRISMQDLLKFIKQNQSSIQYSPQKEIIGEIEIEDNIEDIYDLDNFELLESGNIEGVKKLPPNLNM